MRSAVAYELVGRRPRAPPPGNGGVALGLFVGGLTFFAGDAAIDRGGGAADPRPAGNGGKLVGLFTTLGFAVACAISSLE